jgi:hypothetical protein
MKEETKRFVVEFARKVIEDFVKSGKIINLPEKYPEELNSKKGVFVTLYKKEKGKEMLRGCIGLPYPNKSIIENLREAAVAATLDPRFEKLKPEELKDIVIEVSVLTRPEKIQAKVPKDFLEKIKPFQDGLIIQKNGRSGLFLPQVWKEIPDKQKFLFNLCLKAGLSPYDWMLDGVALYKFNVEKIREDEIN